MKLSQFSVLSTQERQQFAQWNDTGRPLDPTCVPQLFERQAAATPDALACRCPATALTYGRLNRHANRLAHRLRSAGVRPDTRVALFVERSSDFLIALLAVMKAGGCYVPLDPRYPDAYVQRIVDDVQPAWIVTTPALRQRLAADAAVALLDDPALAAQPDANPTPVLQPQHLACVMYTSGSTGRPKGVMVPHQQILNWLHALWAMLPFAPGEVVAQKTSAAFAVSVKELLAGLLAGVPQVFLPDPTVRDAAAFAAALREAGATRLNIVPSHLQALLEQLGDDVAPLRSLRYCITAGEPLTQALRAQVRTRLPWVQLWNNYGCTELNDMTYCPPQEQDGGEVFVPIGRPIANTRLHVLDPALRPVPVGVAGELYVDSIGMARGYWRQPGLTAERFIPNPFGAPGSRLYRTGDMVRYLADGALEYLGRRDFEIKIRGNRIDVRQVEKVLNEHPAVRQAVVAGWPRPVRPAASTAAVATQLIAYVVPAQPEEGWTESLRMHVGAALPAYMVPNLYLALDALPRLPNGKLDRLSLPAPDAAMTGLPSAEQAPESETERTLQDIWSALLDIPPAHIGRHGNFFELGGHSLLATKLLYRIKEKLSLSLSLATLLDNSTLSHLAKTIDAERAKTVPATVASSARLKPDPENRHQPFPLTDIQQAYWLGRQAMPGSRSIATHRYQEFRLPNFDLKRFSDALNLLIRRHDMLRVVIRPEGLQQILEHVPEYQIRHTDLRDLPDEAVATCLRTVRDELSHQVLDPSRWPVFEFRATRVDDVYTHLHVSTDMLLLDASSSRLLANELNQLYNGDVSALPPLGLSFRDYVLAEQSMRNGPEYLRARDYWRQRLSDFAPAPELPLAIDPQQVESPRFTRRAASLKAADWTRLSERARHIGVTPSVVLLTAFSAVLAVWSKQPRYTLNLTLSNRLPLHPEVDALVGDFTSLILLEANMAPVRPFAQYAQALQAQLWRDMDHAAFSGVQVLRELAQMHGMQIARMPVVFTSTLGGDHKQPDKKHATHADTTGAIGETVYGISQSSQVWLDHQVSERAGELIFEWDSFEEIFPDGMLDAMFDAYCRLLNRLVEDDDVWLTPGIDLLPPSCRAMQNACNNTDAPVSDALLHELFDQQARIAPERIAVIAHGRTLSYGELHVMARQLGAQLQSLGAAPNRLIAIVMEKGWEQAVATLGILYAGAAYLPIDPALPAERLHRILESAEASIALTQSELESRVVWPPGVMRIPVDRPIASHGENQLQPVTVSQQDLAYVIFTSGSTGVPKGVMIDHRGAVNTILDINDRFAVTPTDRIFALSSLSFDLSVFDIFGALAAGAAVVIPDARDMRDPDQWIKVLARERVTIWNSVPALLGMLVEHAQNNDCDLPPLALRLTMLSGDWIPLALPDRVRTLLPSLDIVSLGGATEASIWSIYHPIDRVMPHWRSIPYGKPLRNQRFYVLDDALQPRPAWVPGQLYIGGIGLAKGYWRDPQKTDASFIHHPVTRERLYKTGDLGRYLPDGTIEFLGREDFQIKIQGYRIELGDIEAALDSCPDVVASAVSAIGDARGEKSLVAYVVPREGGKPLSSEKLSGFLSNKLPRYMVPTRFVSLERLPLTANGKVDRKALPAPNTADSGSRKEAPSTATEKVLADIWSAQLDGCRIGVHDSFFDLGGNSLDAIRMIQEIKRRFNVTLPPAAVFNAPALADLAEMIDTGRASHSLVVPLAADNDLPALFCIHPAGGQVHSYRELAQVLKEKFRVYAIQSPEAAGAELNFDSLDAMARTYCAVMTATQPAGSYRLVAWSTGAPIAMAIAALLEDQGRDVEYLALLDPAALASASTGSQNGEAEHACVRDALLAALAAVRGSSFSAEELTGMEASLHESGLSIAALLNERNRDIASNHVKKWTGMDATPDMIEHLLFLVKTTQRHFTLLAGYAPRPVRGPLHHCLAVESRNAFQKASATTQHTSIVGGNHYTMLKEPHVRQLADAMTSFIDKQAKADDTSPILDKQ